MIFITYFYREFRSQQHTSSIPFRACCKPRFVTKLPLPQKNHGSPLDFHRHAGDLGNIIADYNGVARISLFDRHISLDRNSPVYVGGLAFVVHAGEDDLGRGGDAESLKTGNAGGREGCGIVRVAQRYTQTKSSYYY